MKGKYPQSPFNISPLSLLIDFLCLISEAKLLLYRLRMTSKFECFCYYEFKSENN